MRVELRGVVLAVGLLFVAELAKASIIITQGPSPTGGLENILFNDSTLRNNSTVVDGISNQTNFRANFTGTETLVINGGQARLEARDGTFDSLGIGLASGALFTDLVFNIHTAADGSVTINANPLIGAPVRQTFDIDEGGQNFFRVSASGGDQLTSVHFTTTVALDEALLH
jgi:hypothetical protein